MQGQILNDIGNAYANATVPWLETLLPMAQRLFLLLATIELIWSGIWWAMATRQDEIVLVRLLRKVVTIMFLYTVVLFAPSWIPMIVSSFVRAGQVASGFETLNPSTVLQQG
ncbi:MAG: type IV secretion system protein, partial [Acidimicrobiia bacterium]|nr:type IV secretion system protein [Acidimicrobiia bacterium]